MDKLKVDAVLNVQNVKAAPILQVNELTIDRNILLQTFLGSTDAKEQKLDGLIDYSSGEKTLRIAEERASFNFMTPDANFISSILNNMPGSMDDAFTTGELPFMSQSAAIEQAGAIFSKLGLTPHLPPKVYALDKAALQQAQNQLLEDKDLKQFIDLGKIKLKDKWTDNDAFYYMIFQLDIHGMACTPTRYNLRNSPEVDVPGSEVRVIWGKQGIVSFEVAGVLYEEQKADADAPALLSMEQALERLKQTYAAIILQNETTVTQISLYYVPVIKSSDVNTKTGMLVNKQLEMVPAWHFTIQEEYAKGGKTQQHSSVVQINAITGKEID